MIEALWYYGKAVGLWLVSAQAVLLANTEWLTPAVGATATITGMAVLVWKLVTDYSREKRISQEYELIIKRLNDEITRLRNEQEGDAR
ncbi:MAG: hypothetical protein N2037_10180 [Acidimicrobiales bacterium]|nr:hypothetical protein [Acidimicrobiales bacterium]